MEAVENEVHTDQHATRHIYSEEEDVSICQYLHTLTHDPTDGLVEKIRGDPNKKKFWEDFKKTTKSERTVPSLISRYHKLVKKLHEVPLSVEKKLDLYYSLSQPVHESFLEEAKRCAHIALDSERNIEAFEMKPEKDRVETKPNVTRKRKISIVNEEVAPKAKRTVKKFTEEENLSMWKFLLEKIVDPETGIVRKDEKLRPTSEKLWAEFGDKIGMPRPAKSYAIHFKKMSEKLHEMPLDLRIKIDLFYGLQMPVNPAFLEIVKQKFEVRTDAAGCIVEYH